MTITRYANTPFHELIRLGEDRHDELITELIQRIGSEIEEQLAIESESTYEDGHQAGYDLGFSEGQDDTIERLDGELCEACTKIVGRL